MGITPFNMVRDINGFNGFGLPFSNNEWKAKLSANTEATMTVPGTENATYPNLLVIFSFAPGSSVWVGVNNTASLPVDDTFVLSNCELNPAARFVKKGDVLHFITSDTVVEVGVVFYAIT